jgi:ABC-2 type transport system ATP-binding protein
MRGANSSVALYMIAKTRRPKNLYAIQTDNLGKIYPGTDYYAISNISITCKEGDIYSFLGENGAGKTTTVKILCTVLLPSAGTAYIKGYSIHEEPDKVRKIIGYLPQKSDVSIFFDWTVWENLKFFCAMNGVTGEEFKRRAEDLLNENDIYQKRDDLFRNLSGGMQQKVALIRSIIHDPEVLFLDEPTAGLDVHSKLQMISFISSLIICDQSGCISHETRGIPHQSRRIPNQSRGIPYKLRCGRSYLSAIQSGSTFTYCFI